MVSDANAGTVSAAAPAWPANGGPQLWRERSGRACFRESQVEGLVEAERHALGVGSLQLLIPQVRPRLVQAVPAVTRVGFLPRIAGPVLKGLRAVPVQWRAASPPGSGLAPWARSQRPGSV